MTTNTSDALQVSLIGGLVYDSSWYNDGRIHETINKCTSSPKIARELVTPAYQQLSSSSLIHVEQPQNTVHVLQSPLERSIELHDASYRPIPKPNSSKAVLNMHLDDLQTMETSDQTCLLEASILECQQHWDKLAKESADKHRCELEEHTFHLLNEAEKNSIVFTEQQCEKTQRLLKHIQHVQKENEDMRQQRMQHQQDRYVLHMKKMEAKMQTAQQKKAEAEMEAEHTKRIAEKQAYLDSMMNVRKQIAESAKKVCLQFDAYKHKDFLPSEAQDIKNKVQQFAQHAEYLVNEASLKGASMVLVETMHTIIESLMNYQECTSKVIGEAEALYQEDMAKKASEVNHAQQQAAKASSEIVTHATETLLPVKSSWDRGNTVLQSVTSAEVLKEYETLQTKHMAVVESYLTLHKTTNPKLKKYRFDLQKAVNVPINAISNQSGTHLLDKLQRLKALLSGQVVDISGRTVSISKNKEGEAFVKDLLAKKIVKQSDEQVSSNNESAFPFATVAVTLWCGFADVGELMLAHFYRQCPFLMPYHITKIPEQSNEEYYKSIGYNYESDGTIEKQDKYLRRMSGFMRLYAAIIVTQPIHNSRQTDPFGIDHAWNWLARLLNVEPQPDITATMLFDFLEVCGHALTVAYSKQFFKLLQILHKSYFSQIEAVTPKGSGGPVMRLKTFLETCIQTQRIAPPKGILHSDFWKT